MTFGELPEKVRGLIPPHEWDNMDIMEQRDWAVGMLNAAETEAAEARRLALDAPGCCYPQCVYPAPCQHMRECYFKTAHGQITNGKCYLRFWFILHHPVPRYPANIIYRRRMPNALTTDLVREFIGMGWKMLLRNFSTSTVVVA
jgi:hypothetical protein